MKYLFLMLFLTSCNALKTLTNGETDIPDDFHHTGHHGPFYDLHWQEGSLINSVVINSEWNSDLEPGQISLEIDYYDNSSCTDPVYLNVPLSLGQTTHSFAGADTLTYTFRLVADYGDGKLVTSGCSSPITIDTSPPGAATALSCSGPTATWTVSTSTDVSYQRLNYFTDAGCSTVATPNTSIELAKDANTKNVSDDLTAGTYYFAVESFDHAGNSSVSSCSPACTVSF